MAKNILAHKILIIDFGSQYTQLIARRVRELGVYCEIYSHQSNLKSIKDFDAKGIILSGGPETVKQKGSPKFPLECLILEYQYLESATACRLSPNS